MATPARNIVAGLTIAIIPVTVIFVPTIFGVDTWKWAIGVLGLLLFVFADRLSR